MTREDNRQPFQPGQLCQLTSVSNLWQSLIANDTTARTPLDWGTLVLCLGVQQSHFGYCYALVVAPGPRVGWVLASNLRACSG